MINPKKTRKRIVNIDGQAISPANLLYLALVKMEELKLISARSLVLHNGPDKEGVWIAFKGRVYDVTKNLSSIHILNSERLRTVSFEWKL